MKRLKENPSRSSQDRGRGRRGNRNYSNGTWQPPNSGQTSSGETLHLSGETDIHNISVPQWPQTPVADSSGTIARQHQSNSPHQYTDGGQQHDFRSDHSSYIPNYGGEFPQSGSLAVGHCATRTTYWPSFSHGTQIPHETHHGYMMQSSIPPPPPRPPPLQSYCAFPQYSETGGPVYDKTLHSQSHLSPYYSHESLWLPSVPTLHTQVPSLPDSSQMVLQHINSYPQMSSSVVPESRLGNSEALMQTSETSSTNKHIPDDYNEAERTLTTDDKMIITEGNQDVASSPSHTSTLQTQDIATSNLKKKSVYGTPDLYLFRLTKMTIFVSQTVMLLIFREGTKNRKANESLFDFYQRNGVPVEKFKKNLSSQQIQKIQEFPNGDIYDITLLFQCILWGGNGVANKNDDKWLKGNDSLESLLTSVKNNRNELYHNEFSFDKQEFSDKIEELRQLLTKTLNKASEYYKISEQKIKEIISSMNGDIDLFRDESLIPLDLETYENPNLFSEKGRFLKITGMMWLCKIYRGWEYLTPVSQLCELNFDVKKIYTEMVLLDDSQRGKDTSIKYDHLLDGISQDITDSVILIEGLAGSGKTTLTRKILTDWVSGESEMFNLNSYNLLLYTACRNLAIRSFNDLVTTLMPEILKYFPNGDYLNVILSLRVIVIVDGLDEFNKSSIGLFQEILELKRTHGLTILATTRPERVKTYYDLAKSPAIITKHVRLTGIPRTNIQTFVLRYYDKLKKEGKHKQNIKGLLIYLRNTDRRLSHLWSLPYNLTLLVILYVYNGMSINSVTTPSEIYWELHQYLVTELLGRLRYSDETRHLQEGLVEKKLENFIYELGHEAFTSLIRDEVSLSLESFRRLEDFCIREGLPTEKMVGTFLKKVDMTTTLAKNVKYSFPHKAFQEFLAALYLFQERGNDSEDHSEQSLLQKMEHLLTFHSVPDEIKQDILLSSRTSLNRQCQGSTGSLLQQNNKVRMILEKHHGESDFDIRKYQNLLTTLLGLFYLKNKELSDRVKREVLELLQETGLNDRKEWLRVLNSVKCDEFVASFISRNHNIYDGEIKIEDSTLFAHLSVLRAIKDPVEGSNKVNIEISIQEETTCIGELLEEINRKGFNVTILRIHPEFQRPNVKLLSEEILFQLFQRCQIEAYVGGYTTGLQLLKSAKRIWVSLSNDDMYGHLRVVLQSYRGRLGLCLAHTIKPSSLSSLPVTKEPPVLYLPDLDGDSLGAAVEKAKALQPSRGSFHRILFPRANLNLQDIEKLLYLMHQTEVVLEGHICFPANMKPSSGDDQRKLRELARSLGYPLGVQWNEVLDDWKIEEYEMLPDEVTMSSQQEPP